MGLTNYLKETKGELKQVNWPTRSQTVNYTLIVIGISLLVTLVLGVSDFVFNSLLRLVV